MVDIEDYATTYRAARDKLVKDCDDLKQTQIEYDTAQKAYNCCIKTNQIKCCDDSTQCDTLLTDLQTAKTNLSDQKSAFERAKGDFMIAQSAYMNALKAYSKFVDDLSFLGDCLDLFCDPNITCERRCHSKKRSHGRNIKKSVGCGCNKYSY